jgi:hypothetical protein
MEGPFHEERPFSFCGAELDMQRLGNRARAFMLSSSGNRG